MLKKVRWWRIMWRRRFDAWKSNETMFAFTNMKHLVRVLGGMRAFSSTGIFPTYNFPTTLSRRGSYYKNQIPNTRIPRSDHFPKYGRQKIKITKSLFPSCTFLRSTISRKRISGVKNSRNLLFSRSHIV